MWSLPKLLLVLICPALLAAAIDPATNADVAACRALAESIGPQSLPQCHIMLAPTYFGYATNIDVKIMLKTIYGLDEKELMEWSGWILMTWTDPRLAWNSSESSLKLLRVDRNSLWLPDIAFQNSKDNEMFDFRNAKFLEAMIYPSGFVYLYTYTVIQFACSLEMRLFPFDSQACSVQVSTVSSDSSVFNFTVSSFLSETTGMEFYQVGEWDMSNLTQKTGVTSDDLGQTYTVTNIRFLLTRRWMYYAILVIVPFELLSLLASIMFLADEKSDPVNLSIAIIMSMTLYVLIASQSAPKSMNAIPLVGLFLMVQMLILIAFTFIAAVINRKGERKKPVAEQAHATHSGSFLKQHRNVACFVGYLVISGLNVFIFLYVWRLKT